MSLNRSNAVIQRHIETQKLRREQKAERSVKNKRQKLVHLVSAHLEKNNNDWSTLPAILKYIANTFSVQGLFTPKQRDAATFMKEEERAEKKLVREVVGPKRGSFHLAFFALASGFKGRPHSHSNVNCVSAVLEGPFTEAVYQEEKDDAITAVAVETREKGNISADLVGADKDKFIHSVGNYNNDKIVYSLHVYGVRRGTNFNSFYDNVTNPGFVQDEAEKQIKASKVQKAEAKDQVATDNATSLKHSIRI